MATESIKNNTVITDLFKTGAHFGYSKARRHPSARKLIFGAKNKVEIIDLEQTAEYLEKAQAFAKELGAKGKTILFVGGKAEARKGVLASAEELVMPSVTGRWVGGSLTNFSEIRKRVEKLVKLRDERENGAFNKHTKKERLMIDRQIEKLEKMYEGLVRMDRKPDALFVVDTQAEAIAVTEAKRLNIPVISISGTDSDITAVDYPVPANDKSIETINYITKAIVDSYQAGFKEAGLTAKSDK